MKTTELLQERSGNFGGGDMKKYSDEGSSGDDTDNWVASAVEVTPRRHFAKEVRLLPNERMGWWSAQKFDRRRHLGTLRQDFEASRHPEPRPLHGGTRNYKRKDSNESSGVVKITLGWERVYVFDVWIMDHNAGVDVVLGTDFMIPAGVRLDLFNATAKLPDEVMVPLIKIQNMIDETEGSHVVGGPTEVLQIPEREWRDFRLQRRQPPPTTHVVWIRSTETFVPTITRFYKQRPARVRLTNLTDKLVSCPVHLPVVVWVPAGSLSRDVGYVRLDSAKYREWQVLAYEAVRDKTLFRWEGELYDQWLARQPSAVEKPTYTTPTGILQRPTDDSEDELSSADDWDNDIDESVAATGDAKTSGEHPNKAEPKDIGGDNSQMTSIECKVSPLQVLENTFISVIRVMTTEGNEANNSSADNSLSILQQKSASKIMHMSSLFFPI
ncbi:unnamed protein product [Phytophthora lilii]|uniref:Unnamed protein product n=1 Tax=Phytophthora lilii TaxID=2077276 RepID=A0A9W7CQC6_9STRA|nr:unnamed protein product [Phytophthora lilii]